MEDTQPPDVDMEGSQEDTEDPEGYDDENDDPIVREIEIYVNRVSDSKPDSAEYDAQMYLLQFPLRPLYRPYGDQGTLSEVSLRSRQRTLQFTYRMAANGENFDEAKRLDLEDKLTEKEREEGVEAFYPHRLQSKISTAPECSYSLGLLTQNRMYVTPVSQVLQFIPDFAHHDEEDDLQAQRAEDKQAEVAGGKGGDKKEEQPKKAVSQLNDKARSALLQSRQTQTPWQVFERDATEPWIPLKTFSDADSPEAFQATNSLTNFMIEVEVPREEDDDIFMGQAGQEENKENEAAEGKKTKKIRKKIYGGDAVPHIFFKEDFEPFLHELCGLKKDGGDGVSAAVASPEDSTAATLASGPLSYLSLSKLRLEDQARCILEHRHVMSFEEIKSLITRSVEDKDLVKLLAQFADLVKGIWVCKSDVVYSNPFEATCRDVLLCLLSLGQPVIRDKMKDIMKGLSIEKLTEMLKQVGVYRDNSWRFKLEGDSAFANAYPQLEVAGRKKFGKDAARDLYRKLISMSRTVNPEDTARATNIDPEKLKAACVGALKEGGVLATSGLLPLVKKKLLEDLASADQRKGGAVKSVAVEKLEEGDIKCQLPSIAEEINGVWVLRRTGDANVDKYRDVVKSLMRRNPKPFKKADMVTELKAQVRGELPDAALRNLLKEFATIEGGLWKFKGNPSPPPASS